MIKAIRKNTTKDYGAHIIKNVWVDSRLESSEQDTNENNLETMQAIKNTMQTALKNAQDSIICLYTSLLDSTMLNLVPAIDKSNRIYVYTKQQSRLQELSHHCLVRVGGKLGGSFVLIQKDKNIQGFFSTKDFDIESNQLFLELDSAQCNEFWHYFITCFWKNAKQEYMVGQEKEITENHQQDFMSPFQNGFDSNFIVDSLSQEKDNTLIQLRENSPLIELLGDFTKSKLLLQDFCILSDEILLRHTETSFLECNVGFDSSGNEIFISDDNILLYGVGLTKEQAEIFESMLQNLAKNKTKSFKHSIALNELVDKTLHYLDGTTTKVEASNIHTDSIQCERFYDKDEFEKKELEYQKIWQEKYPHTCEITYNFDIIPFYTPKEYTDARLYAEWKNTYDAFQSSIESIRKGIESARKKEEELNFLPALLEGVKKLFKQFFLGQKTSLDAIKRDIETIKTELKENNLSTEDSQKFLTILQQCSNNLHIQSGEIDIKLDEAKAHNKWQEEKNKLEKDIEKLQQTCQTKQEELHEKQAEHKDKEAHIDSIQKEIENLSLKEIEKNNLQKELDKLKISKDIQEKTNQKQNIESKLNILKQEIKNLDSKRKECNKAKRDNNTLKQYIATEEEKLQENESKLKNLQNELEKEYKTFSYNPNKQKDSKSPLSYMNTGSAKNTKKDSTIAISIPKENRPSIGRLKENNDTRLLEIETWSEVEEAKNEAARLNAKLSVKPLA